MYTDEKKREKVKFYDAEKGQRVIFIALLLLVVVLPLGRVVSNLVGLNTTMIVQSMTLLAFFVVSMVIIVIEGINNRIPWKKNAIIFACLIISWLFTFVCSFNVAVPKFALIGISQRGEGLLQIGGYYGVFILASLLVNEKFRCFIIYVFLGIASVFSLLGILQFLDICRFGTFFPEMASLPCGNPNHFASFCLLFAGVAMGGFWLYKEDSNFLHPFTWWNKKIWLLLTFFSFIGCITSKSSVIYVGLIMMFLLLLFLNVISRKKALGRIVIMVILFLITMIVFNFFSKGSVWGEIATTFNEIEKEGTIFGDSVGTNRMLIWKNVLGLLPMYWLYGCGIEHLGYVYLYVYGFNQAGEIVDKAHNEYLNLWVTQGIIPLVLYLVFLFALFIPGILQYIKKEKYESNDINMMAIIPFFGYIAQAFFNISVIPTAPYFWLICGLLLVKRKK